MEETKVGQEALRQLPIVRITVGVQRLDEGEVTYKSPPLLEYKQSNIQSPLAPKGGPATVIAMPRKDTVLSVIESLTELSNELRSMLEKSGQ